MAESEITQPHNTLAMILFFIKLLSVVGMNVGIFFKSAVLVLILLFNPGKLNQCYHFFWFPWMLIEGRKKKKSNFPVPLKQKVLLRWLFVLTAMFHKGQKSCLTALLIIFPQHSLKRTRTASALQQLVNNIVSFITVCSTMRGFCNYGLNMSPEAGEPWCSACVTDWLVCLNQHSQLDWRRRNFISQLHWEKIAFLLRPPTSEVQYRHFIMRTGPKTDTSGIRHVDTRVLIWTNVYFHQPCRFCYRSSPLIIHETPAARLGTSVCVKQAFERRKSRRS